MKVPESRMVAIVKGATLRDLEGRLNSAFLNISQHFTIHLFSPWIPNSARGIDGGPRRFTEVVLDEQSLPVASLKLVFHMLVRAVVC